MKEIKEEIYKLVKLLNKYSYDYYVEDNPQISDTEYDTLYKQLEKLEKLETNKERGCFHNESILFFTYE